MPRWLHRKVVLATWFGTACWLSRRRCADMQEGRTSSKVGHDTKRCSEEVGVRSCTRSLLLVNSVERQRWRCNSPGCDDQLLESARTCSGQLTVIPGQDNNGGHAAMSLSRKPVAWRGVHAYYSDAISVPTNPRSKTTGRLAYTCATVIYQARQ